MIGLPEKGRFLMNNHVIAEDVAEQFAKAIRLLIDWIEANNSSSSTGERYSNSSPNEIQLLNVDEVSVLLKTSKSHIYQLIQRGEIPSIRIGKSVRVREKDLNEFLLKNISTADSI